MNLPLEITDKALHEINSIISLKKIPEGYCLRVGSRGSGCSGVNLYLGFDEPHADDMLFEFKGIKVLVKKKDFMHLIGMRLSFVEEHDHRGFVFE